MMWRHIALASIAILCLITPGEAAATLFMVRIQGGETRATLYQNPYPLEVPSFQRGAGLSEPRNHKTAGWMESGLVVAELGIDVDS